MNCSKNHIMCEGGTGIVDARSLIHMLCTTTLYEKGTSGSCIHRLLKQWMREARRLSKLEGIG